MTTYGVPYMGSKNKLAEEIVSILPPANNLYDLFAGGCAITHRASLTNKYKHIYANDITDSTKFFMDCVNGVYRDADKHFVTREDFYREKDKNPFVRIVYSFSNNQKDYIYSNKEGDYKSNPRARHFESIRRINNIRIKTPVAISISKLQYYDVNILPDSVIYCDIPYLNTESYLNSFNHNDFYVWAKAIGQNTPIFISEYYMPEPFVAVWEKPHFSTLSATNNKHAVYERLYTLPKWVNLVTTQYNLFDNE